MRGNCAIDLVDSTDYIDREICHIGNDGYHRIIIRVVEEMHGLDY